MLAEFTCRAHKHRNSSERHVPRGATSSKLPRHRKHHASPSKEPTTESENFTKHVITSTITVRQGVPIGKSSAQPWRSSGSQLHHDKIEAKPLKHLLVKTATFLASLEEGHDRAKARRILTCVCPRPSSTRSPRATGRRCAQKFAGPWTLVAGCQGLGFRARKHPVAEVYNTMAALCTYLEGRTLNGKLARFAVKKLPQMSYSLNSRKGII